MNTLVLLAGDSAAFREAGYLYPKSLIEVDGLPIVQRLIRIFSAVNNARRIYLIRSDEDAQYYLSNIISFLDAKAVFVKVSGETAGAACTALLAAEHIDNDEPLLVVNGDIMIEQSIDSIVTGFEKERLDGGIVVFEGIHPRWSYVRCNDQGLVVEAAEKRPISTLATAGVYYFSEGREFVRAAKAMILKDASVGGRFYVCPAYNEMILEHRRIGVHKITRQEYFSLSSPQGVLAYEEHLREGSAR